MEKGIHIFPVSVVIIPTHLLCQMKANSSGAVFLSTISKFKKRMNFAVIACLRPSQNMTDKAFSRVVVQLTPKKCTKKCDARAKFFFALSSYWLFDFLVAAAS